MTPRNISPRSLENLTRPAEPLQDGEKTESMRVRGPVHVITWAQTLTPSERGDVLAAALAARSAPKPVPPVPSKWRK